MREFGPANMEIRSLKKARLTKGQLNLVEQTVGWQMPGAFRRSVRLSVPLLSIGGYPNSCAGCTDLVSAKGVPRSQSGLRGRLGCYRQ